MTHDEISRLAGQLKLAAMCLRHNPGYDKDLNAVVEKAAAALEALSAERQLREALEAAIRGHLDGPTQMHIFEIARGARAAAKKE